MTNNEEAVLFYTAIDVADLCGVYGFTKVIEECIEMLNRRQHPFTDEEKDAIGMLLMQETSV